MTDLRILYVVKGQRVVSTNSSQMSGQSLVRIAQPTESKSKTGIVNTSCVTWKCLRSSLYCSVVFLNSKIPCVQLSVAPVGTCDVGLAIRKVFLRV